MTFHDDVELTLTEVEAWEEIVAHNGPFGEALRDVYMDVLADEALEGAEEMGGLVGVEVWLEVGEANDAYDAWWAFSAGNELAWRELEDVFSQFIDALGLELFGDE